MIQLINDLISFADNPKPTGDAYNDATIADLVLNLENRYSATIKGEHFI